MDFVRKIKRCVYEFRPRYVKKYTMHYILLRNYVFNI